MSRRYFGDQGHRLFEVDDEVTRGDGDVHVITEVDGTITMRCVKEPKPFREDGEPWCRVDDIENNVASRYHYADPAIEALRPAPEPFKLPEDPGDNPIFTATLLRAARFHEFEMATARREAVSRFITAHIIGLGLATNEEEAGEVAIRDVLKAEREQVTS